MTLMTVSRNPDLDPVAAAMSIPSIVFRQERLNHWKGRLVLPALCVDRRTGKPAGDARFNITENPVTGVCTVTVQGATTMGRRYVSYPDLDAAQRGGMRWARRRFARHPDS